MSKQVKIKKSDPPESQEILAEAIINIGKAMKMLLASGLNRRAVVQLLQAETKLSKRDINIVLNSMAQLERWYCRQ